PVFDVLEAREVPAFLAPVTYSTGTSPAGIAVGDFNHDDRDDMAVVNNAAVGTVSVPLGNGAGGFLPGGSYSAGAGPPGAAAAAPDGDGNLDLVVGGGGA